MESFMPIFLHVLAFFAQSLAKVEKLRDIESVIENYYEADGTNIRGVILLNFLFQVDLYQIITNFFNKTPDKLHDKGLKLETQIIHFILSEQNQFSRSKKYVTVRSYKS